MLTSITFRNRKTWQWTWRKNEVLSRKKKQEKLENMLSRAQVFKGYIKIKVGVSSDLQLYYLNFHFLLVPGNTHKIRKLVFIVYISCIGFPNHMLANRNDTAHHRCVNVSAFEKIIQWLTSAALKRDQDVHPSLCLKERGGALSRPFLAACMCIGVFLLWAIKTAGYFSFMWNFF